MVDFSQQPVANGPVLHWISGHWKSQPLVGEINWTKHLSIMSKCKDNLEKQFYILATKKIYWLKNVLIHQWKQLREIPAPWTNFDATLPEAIKHQAQLAIPKMKYTFGHGIWQMNIPKVCWKSNWWKISEFLLEMGHQFTFVGNQFRLQVDDKEYFVDLLLYHRQLQSLVAVELKVGNSTRNTKEKWSLASVLNDKVKLPNENDAIGIIICKEKNRTVVEYSLKTSHQPIGVATYTT